MPSDRSIQFGSILEREKGSGKVWLVVIPAVVALIGLLVFAMASLSKADGLQRDAHAAEARATELQKAVDERDKLLVKARENEDVLKSAGQAAAIFASVDPGATESGIVFAHPSSHAVNVYLYGLRAPAGQQYAVAARTKDGSLKQLGTVLPDDLGDGFLVSRDVPDGANAIQLLLEPAEAKDTSGATPRISARYPTTPNDRGILVEQQVQARRGRR